MIPIPVHPLAIDTMWPKVQRYLEPAIAHNECSGWTPDTLAQSIAVGNVILFVDDIHEPRNAMTAQFQDWSKRDPVTGEWGKDRVLYVSFMGGEGGQIDWKEALSHIRAYGRIRGAKRVCANLREGWHKYLNAKRLVSLCEIKE